MFSRFWAGGFPEGTFPLLTQYVECILLMIMFISYYYYLFTITVLFRKKILGEPNLGLVRGVLCGVLCGSLVRGSCAEVLCGGLVRSLFYGPQLCEAFPTILIWRPLHNYKKPLLIEKRTASLIFRNRILGSMTSWRPPHSYKRPLHI